MQIIYKAEVLGIQGTQNINSISPCSLAFSQQQLLQQ